MEEFRRNRIHIRRNDQKETIYVSDDNYSDDEANTVKHEKMQNEDSNYGNDGNSFDDHESKEFGARNRPGSY